jgi:hypothetical protein
MQILSRKKCAIDICGMDMKYEVGNTNIIDTCFTKTIKTYLWRSLEYLVFYLSTVFAGSRMLID